MPQYKSTAPTKDGRCWYFKVQYKDSLNNTKVFISKKYATKTEAKDEERKYINKVNEKKRAPIDMTIGDLWQKFLEYKDDKVRISTKRGYHHTEKYIKRGLNASYMKRVENQRVRLNIPGFNLNKACKVLEINML